MSSFNNLPTEEVIAGIQSALVGNVETLRRYGVVANEAAIQQEAINSGISETGKNLTAQEKAQAILNITMKGTTDAQGDLLRTQESSANVGRALNSTLQESQELYGSILNEALTPLKAALTDEIKEINQSVKAWILRNKVLAGEATLVETLVSKQNELEDANDRLAQAELNTKNVTESLNAARESSDKRIRDLIPSYEAGLASSKRLEGQINSEITTLEAQESAIKRGIAEQNARTDAAIAATQAQSELNEETDENTESTNENTDAVEANILAWSGSRDIIRSTVTELSEAARKMLEYNEAMEAAELSAEELAGIGLNSLVSGFEDLGKALVEGGLGFEDFGKIALGAIADVLRSMGAQLAAQAALHFFGLFPNPTAGAGALAGSAAAFAAAGIASGAAGALAEGGSFTTDGPTPLLVGDNPGGQERVTVEPVSSNGANVQSGSGGTMRVVIDFGGGKMLTGMIQEDMDNNRLRPGRNW